MNLTLRDVLGLEIFRNAEAEVIASNAQLDRPVRWVHVSELPDIAHLLKGGELLLTTGMGIGSEPATQRAYIRELADAGVAGLAIELGRSMPAVPPALVAEAEACHVPLVILKRETRYVEVTEEVHSAIISRQFQLLQKAEAIGRRFADLALTGADLKQILDSLAGLVENPVVFENVAHQVVEFATYAQPVDEMLRHWESHSRTAHDDQGQRGVVHFGDGQPACSWIGIWLRREQWGRLHVLHVDSTPGELANLVLDRAAATIGLTLLAQHDANQLADRARSVLISDLVRGRYGSSSEVLRRARSLGADFDGRQLAVVLVELPQLPQLAETHRFSEQDRQRIRQAGLAEVRRSITRTGSVGLCGLEGDHIVALVGVPTRRAVRPVLDAIGQTAIDQIERTERLEVVVGISRETTTDALPLAFEEAAEAARYAWQVGRKSRVQHYDDLGLHQLLLPLADRPELSRFVESELGPLLAHDARSSASLLPTLRVYLARSGNKTQATGELHIERRTLYRRLERIERILGRELDDYEHRARLTLALYGLDLLRQGGRVQHHT